MKRLILPTLFTLTAMMSGSFLLAQSPGFSMGNGEDNWINVEDVSRSGNTLTFSDIRIATDGWLIIHPFQNGAPNGDRVVASTFLKAGSNKDVKIEVYKGVESGEMFIVMLHSDSNANGELDFIFVDAQNVMDRAVFEGSRMIGHAIPAP